MSGNGVNQALCSMAHKFGKGFDSVTPA